MAYPVWILKTGNNTSFLLIFHSSASQENSRLSYFLYGPFCSLTMHKTCMAALTNSVTSIPQSQNVSDLSCIPWSALKPVPGTADVTRLCLCPSLGLPEAYPSPVAPQGPAKAAVLSL